MGQPEKDCHRGAAAGLPSTAGMVTDGHHRWSVPAAEVTRPSLLDHVLWSSTPD
jgi:hypothetical protein